jgi:hypothetical protein
VPVNAELRRKDANGNLVDYVLVDDTENLATGLADPSIDYGARTRLDSIVAKLGATLNVQINQAAEWSCVGETADDELVITKPAEMGVRHYLSGIFVAYNSLVTGGSLTIESPTGVVVFQTFVHNQRDFDFSKAIQCPVGADATLRLDASGLGVVARGTIQGYTR